VTVLGVDPGSRHVGLSILRMGQILHLEEMRLDRDLTIACSALRLHLAQLICQYTVNILAFETMEFRGHATANAMVVLALTGAIRSLADQVQVRAYRVAEWRASLLGEPLPPAMPSEAWKALVHRVVASELGIGEEALPADPGGHIGDALAIALCAAREAAQPHVTKGHAGASPLPDTQREDT
jgi:Holliday junction resolvasome RuvABC endonuclease subunit